MGFVSPFGIDRHMLSPHRALSDAIVTAAVFTEIAKHATRPELVRWPNEPALLSVFRFGKHRGERLDAVPEDYLRWIVEGQNELSEEVRASARYWLDRRASNGSRSSSTGATLPTSQSRKAGPCRMMESDAAAKKCRIGAG